MSYLLLYYIGGFLAVILQTTFLPNLFSFAIPDLLLILVIYIGLNERYLRGSLLTFFLGCLSDVFSGQTLGLNCTVYILSFLAIRSVVNRLNTESSLLLLFMVGSGTLFQGFTLIFLLTFLAETGNAWLLILKYLPMQLISNVIATFLLLATLQSIQKKFFPRLKIPGLDRLDQRYD